MPATPAAPPASRIGIFALVVCLLALAAAVVSFANGSFLGVIWLLLAGVTSNMAWFYVRRSRAARQRG